MKRIISAIIIAAITCSYSAYAEELKIVGAINKVELKGSSVSVEVKDNSSGKSISLIVNDQLTVEKLKDKRIATGDEVRIKYESSTGVTKLLRKTAGC